MIRFSEILKLELEIIAKRMDYNRIHVII